MAKRRALSLFRSLSLSALQSFGKNVSRNQAIEGEEGKKTKEGRVGGEEVAFLSFLLFSLAKKGGLQQWKRERA